MTDSTDRIEKEIRIEAPVARVWRAIADAGEFGAWFGVDLGTGPFTPGQAVQGKFTTRGFEHIVFHASIERVEPPRLLSFRWHPYAIDPKVDYSHEPTTLVVFELEAVGSATRLRLVESGFDALPPERRRDAFPMNARGWAAQLDNVKRHVVGA
jgi:uncharacterized protein YndB with AHSA1/START domain